MNQFKDDAVGKKFAELTLVAFGEKVRDDKLDGNNKRAFFVNLLFGKNIKKAQQNQPELTKISLEGTDLINELQNSNTPFNIVLNAYGDMFYKIFKEFGISDERFLKIYKYISMWTFFVDTICDYEDDFKQKAYNPFYDKDCPTLSKLFDKKYAEILEINSYLSKNIIDNLNSVNNDTIEWKIVYRILEYSLNTVIYNKLEGSDIKFHYFKELKKNWKLGRNENQSNFS